MKDHIKIKEKYIKEKKKLLKEFNVEITPEILEKLEELYPSDILIENYLRGVILKRLGRK